MSIDLKALELALAPIAEIGQGELTFDVGGTPITVRILRPDEERAVQRYAGQALHLKKAEGEEEPADPTQATEYLDRYRIATLSYAIIGVGTTRFPEFVPTGEKLDNGNLVQVERHKALRPMIEKWSRPVMAGCFKKFGELVTKVDKQAEAAIVYEPSDVDAEIERLEERLKSLRESKEAAAREPLTFAKQVMSIATAEEQQEAAFNEEMASRRAEETAAQPPEPPPVQRRQPVTPEVAAPPQQRQPIVPQAAPPPTTVRRSVAPQSDPDSFVNTDDDEEMQRAVEAENARLIEARRRAAAGQPVDDGSVLARRHGPLPPHAAAAAVEQDVGVLEHGRRVAAETARKIGEIGGVETFAMPAEPLEAKTPALAPDDKMPVNARATGSTNPRFRPPPKV